jgi:RND family efflux transporter MFP subunit
MSASRQIAVIVVVLILAAAGWYGYQHHWFGGASSETAATAPAAGEQGQRPGGAAQRQQAAGQNRGGGGGFGGGRGGPVLVVTDAVQTDSSGIDVQAVGTVAAIRAVTVYPQVTGVVTDISFTQGAKVTGGQALIKLDDQDEQIAVDRARIALADAQAAYDRAQQLQQSNNVTAVAVTDAKSALDKATIDLRSAELDLAKRTINAPFDGTVGLTDLSVGDLVSSQKAVANVDDMSTVTVSFSVPERASGLVKVGDDVTATTDALAGQKFTGHVAAVDSRVDPTTRALNVQASLPNDANVLKPGMALSIVLAFPGTPHPSVPSLSVQWDRDGSYVWLVKDSKAERTPVQIITRRSGVVTVAGNLKEGDRVVTEGVLRIREGAMVAEAGSAGQNGQGGQNRPAAAVSGGAPAQAAATGG